jgi:hypothetical protein
MILRYFIIFISFNLTVASQLPPHLQQQQQQQLQQQQLQNKKTHIFAWVFDASISPELQSNKLKDLIVGTTGRFGGEGSLRTNSVNNRLYVEIELQCLLKTDTILDSMGDLRQWVLLFRPPSALRLSPHDMERFLDVQMRNLTEQVS